MTLEPAYFSPAQVGRRLGVDDWTIVKMVRAGKLAHCRVGTRFRIPLSAVEALVERSFRAANAAANAAPDGYPCRSTPGGRCVCFCHAVRLARQRPGRPSRRSDLWTPAHDAAITALARRGYTPAVIAARVSERFPATPRTEDGTRRRLVKLGVSLRAGWWSRIDLIRMLGVSEAKMRGAEQRGLLRVEPYGRWRRIREDEVRRFVEGQAGLLIDPRRVRDPRYKALAETSAIANRRRMTG